MKLVSEEDDMLTGLVTGNDGGDLETVAESILRIKEPTTPTNTIIATNIPPVFFEPQTVSRFRESIDAIAQTQTWVPLKSFMRIVMSFASVEAAIEVRDQIDAQVIHDCVTRVFYGESIDVQKRTSSSTLQVPALEKNWLISPPGSPPVGWTQIREDAPNAQALHEDLLAALNALSEEYREVDTAQALSTPEFGAQSQAAHGQINRSVTILDSQQVSTPSIVVQLEDSDATNVAESNGVGGLERTKVSMVKTPMPGTSKD